MSGPRVGVDVDEKGRGCAASPSPRSEKRV